MELPSTQEIDAVALFVAIAGELEDCRFFIEEHSQLSISYQVADITTGAAIGSIQAHFPDPDTVSAVLIPFRKLWMQEEPCFYRRVANIVKRYCEGLRCRVDLSFSLIEKAKPLHPLLRNVELTKDDVIDLWLNVRYMHSGKSHRRGRFDHSDFDHWNNRIGAIIFEFYFLSSIWDTGLLFFNLRRDAEAFLKWCSSLGLQPSIKPSNEDNPNIQRSTPGFEQASNSLEGKVWRLRRRKKYQRFTEFLDKLGLTDSQIVALMQICPSFLDFCEMLKIKLERVNLGEVNENEFLCGASGIDDHSNVIRLGRVRKGGFGLTQSGTIKWYEDWLELVNEQYEAFRQLLARPETTTV